MTIAKEETECGCARSGGGGCGLPGVVKRQNGTRVQKSFFFSPALGLRAGGSGGIAQSAVAGLAAGEEGDGTRVVADNDPARNGQGAWERDACELVTVNVHVAIDGREGPEGNAGEHVVVQVQATVDRIQGSKVDAREIVVVQI